MMRAVCKTGRYVRNYGCIWRRRCGQFGGTVKEYQVQVDPNALKRYGVTLDQVSQALTNNSSNVGGGTIRRGDEALVVRGQGLFERKKISVASLSMQRMENLCWYPTADVEITHHPRSGIVSYNQGDSYVLAYRTNDQRR
jgi:cobalt-zinc-cadmium resistance protein CzcA